MAKFCWNCGTPLEDNAKMCGKCGTPVDGASTDVPGLKIADPEKQKKTKKAIKLVAILAVIVVFAVIAINIVPKYTGYNGLLRKVMAAIEDYDIDTILSLSSDVFYHFDEDYVDSYFEDTVGEILDNFDSSVGHNFKLTYEINDTYVMSERKSDELLEDLEESYDFDISSIEKIVVADLTLTAKQEKKSDDIDVEVIMVKENGSWKLLLLLDPRGEIFW